MGLATASGFLPQENQGAEQEGWCTYPDLQAAQHAQLPDPRHSVRNHHTFADQKKIIPCCPEPEEVKSALKVYLYLCKA